MWTHIARSRHLVALPFLLLFVSSLSSADPTALSKDWCFDCIKLKNGHVFKGLILEETTAGVRFQHVRRSTGRPTVCMTSVLRRVDIEKIDKIPDTERELLKNRLKELDPTGEGERKRMEALDLKAIDWSGQANAGWRYDSDHFSLISSAPEEIVRRSAIRLEQIYTAYAHFLPPRYPGGKPTTIVLYPSLDDYQKMLDGQGWKLQNPAFFDPASNRIVCGSNLLKLGDDLEKVRVQHQGYRAELDKNEAILRQLYGKKPVELARHMQQIVENRKRITATDKHNDGIFDNETKKLFTILYHEAFHAYVGNFVYPPIARPSPSGPPGELPRWLNEGLAQIFETAIVEAGELRVGHVDKDRISKVKEAIRRGDLMPVAELLRAKSNAFLVQHGGDRLASDRAYLTSWALASYLTFNRRLLGSDGLNAFVRAVNRRDGDADAFIELVGQKMPDFERDFQAWLSKLPGDGTLLETMGGKDR